MNITNHTKGKVTCYWLKGRRLIEVFIVAIAGEGGSFEDITCLLDNTGVFQISPENVDILPLKTTSFTVTFKPVSLL